MKSALFPAPLFTPHNAVPRRENLAAGHGV